MKFNKNRIRTCTTSRNVIPPKVLSPVPKVEPFMFMECPNCGEIELPVTGGECRQCHIPAYF